MTDFREFFRPRPECSEKCVCGPVCRCGYVVLPDGRCMTCHVSEGTRRGETPKGLLSFAACNLAEGA